jgi:hypothetical protein
MQYLWLYYFIDMVYILYILSLQLGKKDKHQKATKGFKTGVAVNTTRPARAGAVAATRNIGPGPISN